MAETPALILASGSPRRRELLAAAGYTFTVSPSTVAEVYPQDLPVEQIPLYLSDLKAGSMPAGDAILLAADTIVILDGSPLEKPTDLAHAKRMLQMLSGRKHSVVTGVTLVYREQKHSFAERTEVYFRELTEWEIDYYITNYAPLDKAGAYGIQEWIGLRGIERIEGDYYNVMGLPVSRLTTELTIFQHRTAELRHDG